MSRGYGIWQRRILTVLEIKPVFYLRHMLPLHPTRAQQVALLRAAHTLETYGKITLTHWVAGHRDQGHIMVARPGVDTMAARRDHNATLTFWGTWREILSVIGLKHSDTDNT
jgi:hypothetical protein